MNWTAEEVRAQAAKELRKGRYAKTWGMLNAFAERIEADESAVPVAYSIRWASDSRLNLSTVFDTEQEAHEWVEKCSGDGEVVLLFTHPPAQPAQPAHEQLGWKVPDGIRVLVERWREPPAGYREDDIYMVGYGHACKHLALELESALLAASPTPPKEN